MPFVKGHSGNPGGKPKLEAGVRELARKYTRKAINTLIGILDDPKANAAARSFAANSLLDRGYGKPTQHIETNVTILDSLSETELRALAAAIAGLAGEPQETTGGLGSEDSAVNSAQIH
jgi:hypothetical protein